MARIAADLKGHGNKARRWAQHHLVFVTAIVGVLDSTSPVNAVSNRAWISSHGVDAAGCGTVAGPCRSLQYAHDHIVGPGGEIDIIDAGSYGSLSITKAISIVNEGAGTATVEQPLFDENAITVAAGPNDAVHLRGLNIDGIGLAANGIQFKSGRSLDVARCVVRHFRVAGLDLVPNVSASVSITDTIASDNGFVGIYAAPSVSMIGTIKDTVSNNNSIGVAVNGGNAAADAFVLVVAADAVAANNRSIGFSTNSQHGRSIPALVLSDVIASGNAHYGILADDHSEISVGRSTIVGSPVRVAKNGTGMIRTLDDGSLSGNAAQPDGASTGMGAAAGWIGQTPYFSQGDHSATVGTTKGVQSFRPSTAVVAPAPAAPAGANGQLQYNNNGAFGGTAGASWDGSKLVLMNRVEQNVGTYNVAVGPSAGASITTGSHNTALGAYALANNTSGYFNTAIGGLPLFFNTTGYGNVAIGLYALLQNTIGWENVAIGGMALQGNTTGTVNTAVGQEAMAFSTTGSYNSAFGVSSLESNSTGSGNTAVGFRAAVNNGSNDDNTAVGSYALQANSGGQNNTALGAQALVWAAAPAYSTALGAFAMSSASAMAPTYDTAVGAYALSSLTTGGDNTGIGSGAGAELTTGTGNTVVGYNAARGLTTGSNNTILGANLTGLPSGLTGTIILATGDGGIRADYNMTNANSWTLPQAVLTGPVILPKYTVAALPNCTAGLNGAIAAVTDAAAPSYNGSLTGGGALTIPVFCNGAVWTAH